MIGSDKQIKWAEEIKANLIRTYEGIIPHMSDPDRGLLREAIDRLNSIDRAGMIIDAYHGIRFSGDVMEDAAKIMACHRNMTPEELSHFMPDAQEEKTNDRL